MIVNKAYRYRIYPTTAQKMMFAKTFGCVRFIYNKMLSDRIDYYKETGQKLNNTPRFRSHFGDRDARRIVDVNGRLIKLVAGIGQARPLFIAVELTCAQFLRVDMGDLAEQSLD